MIRYNITRWGDPTPHPTSGPTVSIDADRTPVSAFRGGPRGCGLLSILLHAAAIGAVMLVMTRPLPPASPEETPIEMVFEQPAPPPEPATDVPPEPPSPVAETPPTPPPEPEEAPPPEPPPPPPKPSPSPKPRLPPSRPVARATVNRPAPEAVTAAPVPAPVAPIVDPNWQASVSRWLAARKTYPEEARRRGEEGRVEVRFTIDRSGRVVEAAIVAGSGSALLDEAALGLLRQGIFPAFPADMTQPRITITETMRYSLR
jgi:periplasmic protein TonB